jgi:hypothetical protein
MSGSEFIYENTTPDFQYLRNNEPVHEINDEGFENDFPPDRESTTPKQLRKQQIWIHRAMLSKRQERNQHRR